MGTPVGVIIHGGNCVRVVDDVERWVQIIPLNGNRATSTYYIYLYQCF